MSATGQPNPPPGLSVLNLSAGYGPAPVLHGVSLHLAPGEVLCLLGRNGAGRSTLLKAVMGLLPITQGQVLWRASAQASVQALHGLPAFQTARSGLGYVPEGRDIFPRLTVAQNLLLGEKPGAQSDKAGRHRSGRTERWPLAELLARFPALAARLHTPAGVLSGGEQQMLALARALRGDPDVLLVDEPTEGLAPRLVEQVGQLLRELPQRGVAVLLVEQKLTLALQVANRCVVLGKGRVVFEGSPQALRADERIQQEWLAV
jgi:branched-chain amino acid transport system ATP-binding protein